MRTGGGATISGGGPGAAFGGDGMEVRLGCGGPCVAHAHKPKEAASSAMVGTPGRLASTFQANSLDAVADTRTGCSPLHRPSARRLTCELWLEQRPTFVFKRKLDVVVGYFPDAVEVPQGRRR
jgi:hypothetical protein